MKKEKKPTKRMKLPFLCYWSGHNSKGMMYEEVGNPDKKIKVWKGYYCSRCGVITSHSKYKREARYIYDYY